MFGILFEGLVQIAGLVPIYVTAFRRYRQGRRGYRREERRQSQLLVRTPSSYFSSLVY